MWSGEKLKPPTKDTHTLRLNLKSPENRQRYPPDDEDLDAIHVISSEYEVAKPVSSPDNGDQLDNYTQIYNTTHDPRFLPKLKYGAVSKSYLKKLSSIFTQHPPTKQIFLDPSQVKLPNGDGAVVATTVDMFPRPPPPPGGLDVEDEGHCSLSDKSSIGNDDDDDRDDTNLCDKKGTAVVAVTAASGAATGAVSKSVLKNHNNHHHNCVMANNNNKCNNVMNKINNNNDNGNRNSDKSGDVCTGDATGKRGMAQFSLPRIALNKQQQQG